MKVALVYPSFSNSIQTTLPEFVNENEGCFPPLGVMYIASYLKKYEKDCDILVIDSVAQKLSRPGIVDKLLSFKPDLVGISCWTFSLIDSLEAAKEIKKRMPDTLICFGGPHATIYPEETLSFEAVDFVITGDGEKPFKELVHQLRGGGDLGLVPNIYYKKDGRLNKSRSSYVEKDLDGLPFPDREATPVGSYYSLMDKERPMTTMVTSRGCPFQCTFCFQQNTGWRYRSVSSIIAEIEHCIGLGIRNFFIFDETFTVNKKRVIGLCDEIKRRKLKIVWSCRSRVDTIDEETIGRLAEAGCRRISFGVESASDEVLTRLNKRINIPQVKEAFRLTKKNGLTCLADFMIGCPGEDKEKAYKSIKLAIELDPDYVQFTLLTLFPATKLYEEALRDGIVKKDVWLEYAKNPKADFLPPIWNTYTAEEAGKILLDAYRMFYMRFSYVLKRLLNLSSFEEFKKYQKAGVGLVKSIFKGAAI